MKPLFFPFTHVRQQDKMALLTCFNRFCHLSVSSPHEVELNNVDRFFPAKEDLQKTLARVEDYRQWAMVNQGGPGQLKTRVCDTPFLTSDTGVSFLKSQIEKGSRKGGENHLNPADKRDAFLNALLFLRIAQESDLDAEDVNIRFSCVARNEKALLSLLKEGQMPEKEEESSSFEDLGMVMTEKRVVAWASFFRENIDSMVDGKPFLPVTTSPAVLDFFKSRAEKSTKVLDIGNFKVHERSCEESAGWQNRLNDLMKNAILGNNPKRDKLPEADDGCFLLADIQLYLFSGENVVKIFYPFDKPSDKKDGKNGLIQGVGMEIPICLVCVKNKNA